MNGVKTTRSFHKQIYIHYTGMISGGTVVREEKRKFGVAFRLGTEQSRKDRWVQRLLNLLTKKGELKHTSRITVLLTPVAQTGKVPRRKRKKAQAA
jgi:hypothetical protein